MPPPRSSAWSFGKNAGRRTLCSLLVALMITGLVVASYALSGGRSDLIQVLSASFSRDFTLASNQSGTERPKEASQAIKGCAINITYTTSNLETSYLDKGEIHLTSRRIPTIAELEQYEPHLFSVIPHQFLHLCRSPCWYQKYDGNNNSDPYGTNAYSLYAKRLHNIFEKMRQGFWSRLALREGRYYRLRCLPHFYIIGQPKCGTTDVYDRLRLHPNVQFSVIKEPHWWTRKRFGIVRLKEPFLKPFPLEDYLDLFDVAGQKIQDFHHEDALLDSGRMNQILTGEASASTMWDNSPWSYFYDNVTNTEPPVLIQDFIHAFQPRAKFIVMLRNPVERLYSDYLYFAISNKSAEDFNDKVNESLQMFESCLQASSLRSCAYNTTFSNTLPVRLQVGLYVVYLWDWLSVFDLDQFLILRLEDHAANITQSMRLVYGFLNLGPLSVKQEASVTQKQASNSRRPEDCSLGPMLPHTRQILIDFYQPYNQKLAQMLADRAFLWET
ncbi:carbohydrate sulfotransferase 15 [Bufo bufo]|uniref:carbohydrate sulfotransferase 15 n=1 Tax=Bufo bufo TaxID=8384 RepID=UPI001ABEDD5E|nr:carbohydrate sulfotransferase 15 [Bufo bufo]XP_040292063.1 carbohydrate sulfotransferase 15 [Bufo bufo]XP_040292065.1 carbohydrate sulfotransferase 15 [Bufo bufo]XP_040292066.1 carbohydrate sulfotransferase 15 [Bufo bufo]